MKITVSRVKVDGEYRYRVNYREGGKRRRKVMPSKSAADKEAARLRNDADQTGKAWVNLPSHERSQMMAAWGEARAKGLSLAELLTQKPTESKAVKTVMEAINELVILKTNAGRAKEYLKGLKNALKQFSKGIEQQPIDTILVGHIESFLDSKNLASRSTLRSRISTLFKFAVRREYCIKNPCEQLEAIIYHKPPPQIFTPEQLKLALQWLTSAPLN